MIFTPGTKTSFYFIGDISSARNSEEGKAPKQPTPRNTAQANAEMSILYFGSQFKSSEGDRACGRRAEKPNRK
jgi:hypothetical protein